MKGFFFLCTLFFVANVRSQTQSSIDSVINLICNKIIQTPSLPDSTRIQQGFTTDFVRFAKDLPDSAREELFKVIYYRLQKTCKVFSTILNRLEPPNGDWKEVVQLPISKLTNKNCVDFLNRRHFTYIENNGDTTNVEITNEYWIDRFKDGTYSKLYFKWNGPCEFEISFIESNHEIRSRMSRPGDKYFYRIIDQKANYYDVGVLIPGSNRSSLFKMYFK